MSVTHSPFKLQQRTPKPYGSISPYRDSEDCGEHDMLLHSSNISPPNGNLSPSVINRILFDDDPSATPSVTRRWSVDRKIKSRYYFSIRSFDDCMKIISMRCALAMFMLIIFVLLLQQAFHYFLKSSNSDLSWSGSKLFDYIIVGAGPAGSVLTRKLVDAGFDVLLIGTTSILPNGPT